MGMSTSVKLLRSKDDPTYLKYLDIFLACKKADISLPKEVDTYFGGDGLGSDPEFPLEIDFEPEEWSDECSEGFEIDIGSLPQGVKTIRFYNSW